MFRGFVDNVRRGTSTVVETATALVSPPRHYGSPVVVGDSRGRPELRPDLARARGFPEEPVGLPELPSSPIAQQTPASGGKRARMNGDMAPQQEPLPSLYPENSPEYRVSPPKRQRQMGDLHPAKSHVSGEPTPAHDILTNTPEVHCVVPRYDTANSSSVPVSPAFGLGAQLALSTPDRSIFSPLPRADTGRTPRNSTHLLSARKNRTRLELLASGDKSRWPRKPRARQTPLGADKDKQTELPLDSSHKQFDTDLELRALQIKEQAVLRNESIVMEADLVEMEKRAARPLFVPETLDFGHRPATNEDAMEMNTDNRYYEEKERKSRLGYVTSTAPLLRLLRESKHRVTQIEAIIDQHRLVSSLKEIVREQETAANEAKMKAHADFEADLEARKKQDEDEVPEDELPPNATVFNGLNPKSKMLKRAEQRVIEHWSDSQTPEATILVDYKGMEVSLGEFRRLSPESWLNDEIINLYMMFLGERETRLTAESNDEASDFPYRKCHFFNSFFYAKLYGMRNGRKEYQFESVRRWTKKIDIFQLDHVLCPINVGNSHWTCGMVNLREKTFEYFDSMGGQGTRVLEHLERWLQDESMHKRRQPIDTSEWRKISHGCSVPQQTNSDDCGVFTCKFIDYLSRGDTFSFDSSDIVYFRTRMAHELLVKFVG